MREFNELLVRLPPEMSSAQVFYYLLDYQARSDIGDECYPFHCLRFLALPKSNQQHELTKEL